MIRFGMVAGEDSGDILGADLINALKKKFPQAIFEGIGGSKMIDEGFKSLFPLERLSVMGLFEPLKRLPELIHIYQTLKKYFLLNRPHVFIGIDAPDFNLRLEKFLKQNGIKTAHYVSPTIWAWREARIHKIKKAIDLMLGIFPFEQAIYREHSLNFCYVGHPLACKIPLVSDQIKAKEQLQLPQKDKIIAILPGSRKQELKYLAAPFIETAKWMAAQDHTLRFITASPNRAREDQFKQILKNSDGPKVESFQGQSTQVMAASDAILVASGTASLEAMLVKRPTVVAYKMSAFTFAIAKRLIKVPFIALPNILANKCLMPEFIQELNPQQMGQTLLNFIQDVDKSKELIKEFEQIHHQLRKNAGEIAANAIMDLMGK